MAADQYAVSSAALTVTKTSAVVEDPFNGTTNPKATPGAFVEYAVAISNTGASPATGLQINDPSVTAYTAEPAALDARHESMNGSARHGRRRTGTITATVAVDGSGSTGGGS